MIRSVKVLAFPMHLLAHSGRLPSRRMVRISRLAGERVPLESGCDLIDALDSTPATLTNPIRRFPNWSLSGERLESLSL